MSVAFDEKGFSKRAEARRMRCLARLRCAAHERNVTVATLRKKIIEAVVLDGLIEAVLDDTE